MSYTQQLYKLQQLDRRIDTAKKRLQEIAASLVETKALKTARLVYKEAEEDYLRLKAQATDLDLEVKSLQQKITNHENRLYGGKLVNPKEAASLQDEIASTKRWLAKREEDFLTLLIEQEETEETLKTKKEVLAKVEADWKTSQANLLQEQKDKLLEIDETTKGRQSVAQFIDPQDLTKYERLRQKNFGIGLTTIENNACSSCGVMLSNRLVQQASNANQLNYCDSCGRIIHLL